MQKKFIISSIVGVIALSVLIVATLTILSNRKPIVTIDNTLTNTNTPVVTTPVVTTPAATAKLTCYDFIDKMLTADGFTYLERMKWGRGQNNLFVIDLATTQFQMADFINPQVVPVDWYSKQYDKYILAIYHYNENKVINMNSKRGGLSEDVYTIDSTEIKTSAFMELPAWMNYYVTQPEKFGCPIAGLTEAKLTEYKGKTSKATAADIVSVFDLKSVNGVIHTFADVHTTEKIEKNPRYKQIQSYDELMALKAATGFEGYYMLNILNSNTKKVYDAGEKLQANVISEFVKDVVFSTTLSKEAADASKTPTIGAYFINVDNPNNNFKNLYIAPQKGVGFNFTGSNVGKDLRSLRTPYMGTVLGIEKDLAPNYEYSAFSISTITKCLGFYITLIQGVNPDVKFGADFIFNYTRPFDHDWQERWGLTKLFDAKYGFIDHSIQYIN